MLFTNNLFEESSSTEKEKPIREIRNIPFSYYNSQTQNVYESDGEKKTGEKEERSLKEKIENQIKNKYNLIIPAILIEIQENGKNSVKLLKDDLKNLLTSLGAIKHIEINSQVAYVLYEHYFSALLGYNILNDIITKEKKNFITVKLFTKEEDEEKQLKVNGEFSKNTGSSSNLPNGNQFGFGQDVTSPYGSFYSPLLTANKSHLQNLQPPNFNFYGQSKEKIITDPNNANNEYSYLSNLQQGSICGIGGIGGIGGTPFEKESCEKDEEVILENFFDDFSTLKIEEERKKEKKNKSDLSAEIKQTTEESFSKEQIIKSIEENSIFSSPFTANSESSNIQNLQNSQGMQNTASQLFYPKSFSTPFYPTNYPQVCFAGPVFYPFQFLPESNFFYSEKVNPSSPNFSNPTSGNDYYVLKFVCNYDIQIENDSQFRVTRRLIGNKGLALKKILYDCCNKKGDYTTKIRLRGKGSGYKEAITKKESEDPLQLCVSSLNYFTYVHCCQEVEKLLLQIYQDYFNFIFNNNQLTEASPKKIMDTSLSPNEIISLKRSGRPTTARPITSKISRVSFDKNILVEEKDEESVNIKRDDLSVTVAVANNKEEKLISNIQEMMDSIQLEDQRKILEKMLIEENEKIEIFNSKKQKLKDINLIENNTDGLYDWGNLFSKSRPISAYTCTHSKFNFYEKLEEEKKQKLIKDKIGSKSLESEKNQKIQKELDGVQSGQTGQSGEISEKKQIPSTSTKKKKKKGKPFIFPVALIDEKEVINSGLEALNKNIKSMNKNNRENNKSKSKEKKNLNKTENLQKSDQNDKNEKNEKNEKNPMSLINNYPRPVSNATRPQSVYAKRSDNDVFYLDRAFSEYYTQEEGKFAEKFPLLHPKVRCDQKKLKTTLQEVKMTTMWYDEIKNKLQNEEEDDVKIEQKDLNLAGNSKNPVPLLRSIYRQVYPDVLEAPIPSNKIYPNSNKPLGNSVEYVDLKNNVRSANMMGFFNSSLSTDNFENRIKSARINTIPSELKLETYSVDDPEILIFSKNINTTDKETDEAKKTEIVNILLETNNQENILNQEELNKNFENIPEIVEEWDGNMGSMDMFDEGNFGDKIKNNYLKQSQPQLTHPISNSNSKENNLRPTTSKTTSNLRPKTAMVKQNLNTFKSSKKPSTAKLNSISKTARTIAQKSQKTKDNFNNVGTGTPIRERSISPLTINESNSKASVLTYERKENSSVKIFINENINFNIQDSTEYIPPNYKCLPYKRVPANQPYSYKMMNMRTKGTINTDKKVFEDVMQILNVNEDIKEISNSEGFSGNKIVRQIRPKTSSGYSMTQRPLSKINYNRNKEMETIPTRPLSTITRKDTLHLPMKKVPKLNTMYFNEYIDMQFKNKNSIHTLTIKSNFLKF